MVLFTKRWTTCTLTAICVIASMEMGKFAAVFYCASAVPYINIHTHLHPSHYRYTLGPVTSDHWFVFVADHTKRYAEDNDTDRVLNIMMFDIDQDVAQTFYYDRYEARVGPDETDEEATKRISMEQTKSAGIDTLVPGATIDPRAFEPCGYSMNAILFRSYSTMHITPEEGSSYASFETNQKLKNYTPLISNVVRAFKPKRFCLTMMADQGGLAEMGKNPLFSGGASSAKIDVPFTDKAKPGPGSLKTIPSSASVASAAGNKMATYRRKDLASITVEDDQCCYMGNWVLEGYEVSEFAPGVKVVPPPSRSQRDRGLSVSHYD